MAMAMEPGFRFHPTRMEIVYYLRRKNADPSFSCTAMGDLDLYKYEPWCLPRKAKFSQESDESWWFFNSPKRGAGKSGASRSSPTGFWKSTRKDLQIQDNSLVTKPAVACRKSLVFYMAGTGGRKPASKKTGCIMHEYTLCDNPEASKCWVICHVFQKDDGLASGGGLPLLPATKAAASSVDVMDDDVNGDMMSAAANAESTLKEFSPLPPDRADHGFTDVEDDVEMMHALMPMETLVMTCERTESVLFQESHSDLLGYPQR